MTEASEYFIDSKLTPGSDEYLRHMRDLLRWLHRKWEPDILALLARTPMRYTDLLQSLRMKQQVDAWNRNAHHSIADKVLNETLRGMLDDGLVTRQRDESLSPPTATYRLTPAAGQLMDALLPAVHWVAQHPDVIERAQHARTKPRLL